MIILKEAIKKRVCDNVEMFAMCLYDELQDLGFDVFWASQGITTNATLKDIEKLKSSINFVNGKKTLAKAYLINDYLDYIKE